MLLCSCEPSLPKELSKKCSVVLLWLGNAALQFSRPVGDATKIFGPVLGESLFQSTRPVGDATNRAARYAREEMISIHASRGGRDNAIIEGGESESISIHVSRGGRDVCAPALDGMAGYFNPRVPWGTRRR